jgi:hypothetical protein
MERTRMGKLGLQPGRVFWYWYDFGDDWVHSITVLSVGEAEPGARYPQVVASVGESPPQYRSWDDEDLGDPVERASRGHEPRRTRGGREMSSDIETGVTPFPDGSVVEWQHEVLSPGEAEPMVGRAVGRTYRVTTFRQLRRGALVIGTYHVPGAWLNACVREIGRDEGEVVLSVEVVDSADAGGCTGSGRTGG